MSRRKPLVLGVLVSGRGSNLQAILDAIAEGRLTAKVAIVVSNRQKAEALARAARHGAEAVALDPKDFPDREAFDRAVLAILKKHDVELVVLAGYLRIITKPLIEAYRHRIINIHPALLPAFPGLHAVQQALDSGVKTTGCTVHVATDEVDQGPIITQAAVPVEPTDTEATLAARIRVEEHRIYPLAIQWFAEGRVRVEGNKVIVAPAT